MSNLSQQRRREIELELQEWTPKKIARSENMIIRNQSARARETSRESLRRTNSRERTCPHCQLIIKGNNFYRDHNDNCFLKGKSLLEFQSDIRTMSSIKAGKKWGITDASCLGYAKKMGIDRPNFNFLPKTIHTCSICSRSGGGHNFLRRHNDNCELNNIDIQQFQSDILNMSMVGVHRKYNLCTLDFVRSYKRDMMNGTLTKL